MGWSKLHFLLTFIYENIIFRWTIPLTQLSYQYTHCCTCSILGKIEFSAISQKTVSNQLQLRAQVELKMLSVYQQLGVLFPLVIKWSHDLFWPIMHIIFSVKWIFSLWVHHVCWYWPSLLRSDPWPHRGRYKSTHCLSQRIMLQIAIERTHQSFLYFTVIFHPKGK